MFLKLYLEILDDRKATIPATKLKIVSNTRYITCLSINFLLVYKPIRKMTLESTRAIAKTANTTKKLAPIQQKDFFFDTRMFSVEILRTDSDNRILLSIRNHHAI